MIFALNEKGDLYFDNENENITNIIYGDQEETNYKMARTIIISYFSLNNIFKDEFVKNKRNIITDPEIKTFVNNHLDIAFSSYPNIKSGILYEFSNKGKEFSIFFMYKSKHSEIRSILNYEITI